MNEATARILERRIEAFFDVEPVSDDRFTEMLKAMRADFPASAIGKLPRAKCKTCGDGDGTCQRHPRKDLCAECNNWHSSGYFHLDFVGHAHLTERLNEVDPGWDWLPMAFDDDGAPKITSGGSLWIILRFGGRFFQGVGDAPKKKGGDAVKEMIGDALRNVGMRRGAALSLWMKERDVADDETPVNGTPAPDSAVAKAPAAPAKQAAKKAPAAKKQAAKQAPEGIAQDVIDELTAMLAALPEPEMGKHFIKGRQVDPETWKGLTPGKVRSIRSALTNMAKVQAAGNPPLSTPPEPEAPAPPAPPAFNPEAPSVRVEMAERAEKLPEPWAKVLQQEIVTAGVKGVRGTVGEYVLAIPPGDDWDAYLEGWLSDAEAKLKADGDALPPGGEPFES